MSFRIKWVGPFDVSESQWKNLSWHLPQLVKNSFFFVLGGGSWRFIFFWKGLVEQNNQIYPFFFSGRRGICFVFCPKGGLEPRASLWFCRFLVDAKEILMMKRPPDLGWKWARCGLYVACDDINWWIKYAETIPVRGSLSNSWSH